VEGSMTGSSPQGWHEHTRRIQAPPQTSPQL
jgi:hypothetical protein